MYVINVDKLIEIFIDCDDFCQVFSPLYQKTQLQKSIRFRNTPRLSESEIMTILIFYHLSGMKCFKYYYNRIVRVLLKDEFPNLVSYNRFVELSHRTLIHLWVFLNTHRTGEQIGFAYVDSKKLTVCHNRRIPRHKVFDGIATRGHCSVGWFFGFKLFLAINPYGEILNCFVTPGNVADNDKKVMRRLFKGSKGKVYGDKGFISKSITEEFLNKGLQIITKIRSNMKNKLMFRQDSFLLSKRGIIETVFDIMSAVCDIDHSRHRSPRNAFTNLFAGIVAYAYLDKLPSIISKKMKLDF